MLGAFVRALVRAPARRVARSVSHLNAASAGGLRLRDAATKEVVDTAAGHGASRDDGVLKWYACGPTVYDATHLGHARTYVTLDLVRRAATEYGGSRVDFAMGVTDVDDKIINRAKELGLEPLELARREEANFFEDLDRLGCLRPDRVLRVSEHVDDIVAYVGDIVDRGFGYATEGGDVWFDVGKLGDAYGAFAEGRAFETGPDEAWVANAYGHSVSIVTAVGASTPSVLTRRDRGWYHYMVNISALAFAGPSETNGNGYFATCQANSNDYTGLKDPNYFQGPSLYSLSNEHPNLVNAAGDACAEGEQGAPWSYRYVKNITL